MLNWIVWKRTVYMNENGFGNIKHNQTKLGWCDIANRAYELVK